jgi:hypothetical protein
VSTETTNARALAASLLQKHKPTLIYTRYDEQALRCVRCKTLWPCTEKLAASELERLADLEDGPCQCCGKACKCKEFAGELSDGA